MSRLKDWKELVSETDAVLLYRTPATEEAQGFLDMTDRFGTSMKGWKVFWAESKVDDTDEYVVFDPEGKAMHASVYISSVLMYIDIRRIQLHNPKGDSP